MKDEGYAIIKFRNTEAEKVDFAIGPKGDVPPNTKSGMLGNDSRIIFEYKMEARDLEEGDILEYYDANGKLKATYDYKKIGEWEKRK